QQALLQGGWCDVRCLDELEASAARLGDFCLDGIEFRLVVQFGDVPGVCLQEENGDHGVPPWTAPGGRTARARSRGGEEPASRRAHAGTGQPTRARYSIRAVPTVKSH